MKQVYFCFPYRGYGGVAVQFSVVANVLADREYEVFYIDYKDGASSALSLSSKVVLVEYCEDKQINIPANAILVMQAMTPWSIFGGLDISCDTKLVFWGCHPMNFLPSLIGINYSENQLLAVLIKFFFKKYFAQSKIFLELLFDHSAIIFIDGNTSMLPLRILKLDASIGVSYVPVPINLPGPPISASHRGSAINACWVGRLCDFKYTVLLKVMDDLDAYAAHGKKNVIFKVIGDGPFFNKVRKHASRLKNLNVLLLGGQSHSDIAGFLGSGEVDVFFGMGTSALEAAAHRIPTVLLDFSYKKVPDWYTYKILCDAHNFSVGGVICKSMRNENSRKSISKIMESILSDAEKQRKNCYEYVEKYHCKFQVTESLVKQLSKSTLTWSHVVDSGTCRKGLLYRIRSWYSKRKRY